MGLNNLVRSRGFRNFMAKLYGWGASVVILGALFKINHYPYADLMLIIGLGTESLIFFFSAFEPPHVEPDWSLVYPELSGMYQGEGQLEGKKSKKKPIDELDDMLAEAKIEQNLIQRLGEGIRRLSDSTLGLADISDATSVTSEYVENVKVASSSVGELSDSYAKTNDLLNQGLETTEMHSNNLKAASTSAASLSSAYDDASNSIRENLGASDEFATSVRQASDSANILAQKYSESAEKISESADKLDFTGLESKDFHDQLKKVSENLVALNTVYELQLQGTNENVESNVKLQSTLSQFLESLNSSVEKTSTYQENLSAINEIYAKQLEGSESQVETAGQLKNTMDEFLASLQSSIDMTSKYKVEVDSLAQNVAALNKVYGNMLSAMNVNIGG